MYQETRQRLDTKYLKEIFILKSTATSSLLEYTGNENFVSFSPTKRQITFMGTLLLHNSGTIFRTRPVLNQSVEPELRSRYALPKTVRFSYRKCLGEILLNCACYVTHNDSEDICIRKNLIFGKS